MPLPPRLDPEPPRLFPGEVRATSGTKPKRDRLQVAIILNQLATPGLGSWIAGHRIAGAGQLLVACSGFVIVLADFGHLLAALWHAVTGYAAASDAPVAISKTGLTLFLAAWCWSGITSLQLYLELRRRRTGATA